ncbi:vitelline membrane outer layer protein 1-like [Zootoca vivipara]|uniref:vitelline membrane outer layer protein 1-like n=1 Tax=Zootoca vivipara TaxID=8524 RepID=UPI00293BBC6B|nr:vitelline membrane outer layer protein 1-like [Zootoca vivipara]
MRFIAVSFSLFHQVQEKQGKNKDDTSLNGIRLHCNKGAAVESTVGPKGNWTKIEECRRGLLISFDLRVEGPQLMLDDTAANNIQFSCTDGTRLEGKSTNFGTYGPWSKRCTTGAICGIQTKVEASAQVDSTALNDAKFFCCN